MFTHGTIAGSGYILLLHTLRCVMRVPTYWSCLHDIVNLIHFALSTAFALINKLARKFSFQVEF